MAQHDLERREQDRRITRIETQVDRLVSDVESEKAARARVHVEWMQQVKSIKSELTDEMKNLDAAWTIDFERLSTKIEKSLSTMESGWKEQFKEHNHRIHALERRVYIGVGILTAVVQMAFKYL